ncbi:Butyrophilin subfamily 1 member A1 [Holothuria leucospilota]|uniref:Butyrophilin subfamily 1 member A1 n=1 Tax=Holothuria leucospilota TaxID=206669 RepID=A0A9Q1CUN1_HOLLE|nr:Butyrophilin subfamily 1 member A1 [Holothuria leucospilota]
MVIPIVPFPEILNCSKGNRTCFLQGEISSLLCVVNNVRPNISLSWLMRTPEGDKNISYKTITTPGKDWYTTSVKATDVSDYSLSLALLICQANSPSGMFQKDESLALIQRNTNIPSSVNVFVKYTDYRGKLELVCTEYSMGVFVWKKAESLAEIFKETMYYATFLEGNLISTFTTEYEIKQTGSLIIQDVRVQNEGFYGCIFSNDSSEAFSVYSVIAYVSPLPAYPIIDRCNHQQHCVLESEHSGNLSCTVEAIRPLVQLEWRTVNKDETALITFTNQKLTVKENEETYDVSVITTYSLRDESRRRLMVECKVIGSSEVFRLSSQVDLLFTSDPIPLSKTFNSMALVTTVIVIAMFLIVAFLAYVLNNRKRARKQRKTKAKSKTGQEITPMLHQISFDVELLNVKKDQFEKQLREKYKDLYDAVQPIPYIKDRLYCVDKVFVEGGIEFMKYTLGSAQPHWTSLESYQNMFDDIRVSSKRRILEGDPGYGKSTITLQFAYGWCNCIETSPLKDVEILILLRLRQLGGIKSIYRAIKQFILPKDSQLDEADIESILLSSSSVVVIMDGFDEYPDQDDNEGDVNKIIAREMFQEFEVVLTTRSSCLPPKCPPLTKRIRLTGFDGKARRYYIRKAVVGDNETWVQRLEGYLEENAILSDLCQVPLLFVIFAHMSYESEQFRKLNSVTSFFRFMISCFHSHMRNKLDNANFSKYESFENSHSELDEMAFEALRGDSQKLIWKKDDICKRLNSDLYEHYKRIGILVEEEVIDIMNDPGRLITEHIKYEMEVRFYHKLFCEWYAAHHVSGYLELNPTVDLREYLQNLDPFDLQYVYRFACGLDPQSADKIIDYLQKIEGGDKFAILCILEKTGNINNIKNVIQKLCDDNIVISGHDSLLLQRSSMQLLDLAAKSNICLKFIVLQNCLKSIDPSSGELKMASGLILNAKLPFIGLQIELVNRDITDQETKEMLKFSAKCEKLQTLWFYGCVPSQMFEVDSTLLELSSRKVKVKWRTVKYSAADTYTLNLQTGQWQNDIDGNTPSVEYMQRMRNLRTESRRQRTEEYYKKRVKNTREYWRTQKDAVLFEGSTEDTD